MAAVTFTIEPDELRGLAVLAELNGAAAGGGNHAGAGTDARAIGVARELLDTALADRLARAGLPWAPAAEPLRRSRRTFRRNLGYAIVAAVAVLLWGGYARGWQWTGFQANGQLWDWLSLLLLPTAIGLIPLWLQYKRSIGRNGRAVAAAVIVAWTGFVLAGYLVPIGWTGFRGQTLWNWFGLLLLPAALTVTAALTSMRVHPAQALRSLPRYQQAIVAVLAAAWVVSVIGGYALRWRWTGYTGNTLWDWLQLLLLPLVVPTVLLPALLSRLTGDVTRRSPRTGRAPAPA